MSVKKNTSPNMAKAVLTLHKIEENPKPVGIEGPSEGFMARNTKYNKAPMVTDWDVYRKRNDLLKKDRIFICKEYYHFKKALLARGWHENTDYNSPIFHLKFTVKSKDVFKL